MLLYIDRNHQAYWGRGAQDSHLDFHTAPELHLFSVALRSQRPYGVLWMGGPGRHLDFTQLLGSALESSLPLLLSYLPPSPCVLAVAVTGS